MESQRVRRDLATKQQPRNLHIICAHPPIYFKFIFRLLIIPNSSFALLGLSRIFFFFFFFFFSIFNLWLVDSMDAESADMEGCVCIYEIQLSYLSPVPGVIQLLTGHSRKKQNSCPQWVHTASYQLRSIQCFFSICGLLKRWTAAWPPPSCSNICQASYLPGKGSPALPWPSATTNFYIYANSRSLPPLSCLFFLLLRPH